MGQRMWLLFVGPLVTTGALILVSEFDDRDDGMIDFLRSVLLGMSISFFVAFVASRRLVMQSLFCSRLFTANAGLEQNNVKPQIRI